MQHYLVTFAWSHPVTGKRMPFRTLEAEPGHSLRDVVALIEEGTKDVGDQHPSYIRVICADLDHGTARDVTEDALHEYHRATGAAWAASPMSIAAE
ncbi:hypothetical protein HOY34_17250 [Xinfangfangia sp. D13-10-4-6]|uniref:hypothetical protein n=1 Tax=Pseudogemmobacter hezensis TaxID=2737662 RepID=UPI00155632C8|nr:hypothetical protein [Pseudogemmobacter hezensis]NPD16942.1 hypothetical protein [Pseudogemmobacter hezensis]